MTATDPHTSVHNIETSAHQNLPTDYREFRRRHCLGEFEAVHELYSALDTDSDTLRLDRLDGCRGFAYFARNLDTGKVRVVSNACKLRWCPICAKARSNFLTGQVHDWLKTIRRPKFLTLTMKHSNAPLEHQIKWLYAKFRKFRSRKLISRKIRGGLWFFQLKQSKKSREWHPHLHTIIDAEYIKQSTLSREWKATTGHSSIVDIRSIKSDKAIAEYISRYCSRPCNLKQFELSQRIEIHRVFHGKRLCGTWGTGRNCKLSRSPVADRDSWVPLGSWGAVTIQQNTLPRARCIIKAWLCDKTVPSGIHVDYPKSETEKTIDAEGLPRLGIDDITGNFKEFL